MIITVKPKSKAQQIKELNTEYDPQTADILLQICICETAYSDSLSAADYRQALSDLQAEYQTKLEAILHAA